LKYDLEIECPTCCGRGYKETKTYYSLNSSPCETCNGLCKIKNVCRNCGAQIKHKEGYLVCTIKCFVQLNSGKTLK
jgi:DnaJ-class molecular chaperone